MYHNGSSWKQHFAHLNTVVFRQWIKISPVMEHTAELFLTLTSNCQKRKYNICPTLASCWPLPPQIMMGFTTDSYSYIFWILWFPVFSWIYVWMKLPRKKNKNGNRMFLSCQHLCDQLIVCLGSACLSILVAWFTYIQVHDLTQWQWSGKKDLREICCHFFDTTFFFLSGQIFKLLIKIWCVLLHNTEIDTCLHLTHDNMTK